MMRGSLFLCLFLLWGAKGFTQTLLLETFNSGINTAPGGWTIVDGGSSNDTWFGTVGGFNGDYLNGSEFAFVNSDGAGPGNILLDEQLVSPVVNAAGATTLLLEFIHYYRSVALTDTGFVDVWDGTQWIGLDTMLATRGSFVTPATELYDISAFANANLQIRFSYKDDSTWAWYWGVDEVRIYIPSTTDASVTQILAPFGGGRLNTSSALTATETVQVEVINLGSDTLTNIPVSFSLNGSTVATEVIPGPLFPNVLGTYTFTATGNFLAAGNYDVRAWTSASGDTAVSNDTASAVVRQLLNAPVAIPLIEHFDAMPDSSFLGSGFALPGVDPLDFASSSATVGRLRTFPGGGFSNSGQRALTLDRSTSGSLVANEAILTYNLSNYNANADVITLELALMDHGDEVHAGDSIWVRGDDQSPWIPLLAWNDITGTNDGIYFFINGVNLSAALLNNGQNFTGSFQVKIGQEDNFPTTSTTSNDGLTIDDFGLNIELDSNAAPVDILAPRMGDCGDSLTFVSVLIENEGNDTISNIPVFMQVSGASPSLLTGTVAGPLPPTGRDTLIFATPINTSAGGNVSFGLYTAMPSDQFNQDDTLNRTVSLVPVPAAPVITGDTLTCVGSPATLAVQNADPGLTYVWYDGAGQNIVHYGNTYTLPGVTSPLSLQVEPGGDTPYTVGRPDNQGPGGILTTYSDGQVFNVFQEITVDSMDVYPNQTGLVSVVFYDVSSNIVGTATDSVFPSFPGEKITIPVGVTLPAGNGYQVNAVGTTTGGLFRNDASSVYPYVVPNVIEINQTINGLHINGYYYFFYNWKITARGCPGPRTTVAVDTFSFVPTTVGFNATPNGLDVGFAPTTNNASSFVWDFGDGNTSNQSNPTHSYAAPGTYVVCVIGTGPCVSDTFCNSVTVTCGPLVSNFSTAENGLQVGFGDLSGAGVAWQWDFGDGNGASVSNPLHTYPADGSYLVCLTVTDICGQQDQFCDSIQVCDFLLADFTYSVVGNQVNFVDLSNGTPTDYNWNFGDGNSSNQSNPSHQYSNLDSFSVTMEVINLCGDTSEITYTVSLVGLENQILNQVLVYPNPNQGQFSVQLPEGVWGKVELEMLDLMGRRVLAQQIEEGSGQKMAIEGRNLATGTYLLRLRTEMGTRQFRVVIE